MSIPIPTTLDNNQLEHFKKLHKKHFNIDITDEQALDEGVRLIQLIALLLEFEDRFNN